MATGVETTIDVKLFVDKERNRVLFAESGKEFVDVLFGFITLPLGTVVRLLGGQSQVGCLDELYRSVEGLSPDLFRTEACKAMLLRPINAAAKQCCQLKVRVDDTKHREVYVCGDTSCSVTAFSSVPGVVCRCGGMKFIVTDDLKVAPASTSLMLTLLDEFQVPDPSSLEQRILQFSSDKIIDLLRRSLTSQNPLTDHYLDVAVAPDHSVVDMLPEYLHPKEQDSEAEHSLVNANLRVLQTKNNSKVLYAEVGGDFVDLLFGLLTMPLGSILKRYGRSASKGCFDNVYTSIDGSAQGCLRPECQNLLLSPMLAPFFGCGASTMLQVQELAPDNEEINACLKCIKDRGFANLATCHEKFWYKKSYHQYCNVSVKTTNLCELDAKSPKGGSDNGGAYVKQGPQKFIVTDDLHVLPLSLASTLQVVIEAKLQRKDLVEKEVALTKPQAMELLRAAMVTRRALSTVLLPPIPKINKKLHYHSFGLY
ncbi:uncharacterized protein LOC119350906 [Triticum dicoccoides]|uniref:uncharacterized protein LOC119350906 n=1 Tax=Triticum dicoccoides TaxID=85692 RepID=UPI00188F0A91|nr:uncharacterized protein LOC119350906 [Triticum dicoccoides]XP_044360444.1 uncharacterized protein LOC123082091 [Triticum aestivum]